MLEGVRRWCVHSSQIGWTQRCFIERVNTCIDWFWSSWRLVALFFSTSGRQKALQRCESWWWGSGLVNFWLRHSRVGWCAGALPLPPPNHTESHHYYRHRCCHYCWVCHTFVFGFSFSLTHTHSLPLSPPLSLSLFLSLCPPLSLSLSLFLWVLSFVLGTWERCLTGSARPPIAQDSIPFILM